MQSGKVRIGQPVRHKTPIPHHVKNKPDRITCRVFFLDSLQKRVGLVKVLHWPVPAHIHELQEEIFAIWITIAHSSNRLDPVIDPFDLVV